MAIRTNLPSVISDLREARQAIPGDVADAVQDGSAVAVEELRAASPVRTGELRRSWRVTDTPDGARIENDSDHASFVDVDVEAAVKHAGIEGRIERSINSRMG